MHMDDGNKENDIILHMKELRKKDVVFDEMVRIIENKIEEQIQVYNDTKTTKADYVGKTYIKVFVPAFPMTPDQRITLKEFLNNKYLKRILGNYIEIRNCIFFKKYKIQSKSYSY